MALCFGGQTGFESRAHQPLDEKQKKASQRRLFRNYNLISIPEGVASPLVA